MKFNIEISQLSIVSQIDSVIHKVIREEGKTPVITTRAYPAIGFQIPEGVEIDDTLLVESAPISIVPTPGSNVYAVEVKPVPAKATVPAKPVGSPSADLAKRFEQRNMRGHICLV